MKVPNSTACVVLLAVIACSTDGTVDQEVTGPAPAPKPAAIAVQIEGNRFLDEDLRATATVTDADGKPMSGVRVNWSAWFLARVAAPGCVQVEKPPPSSFRCLHDVARIDSVSTTNSEGRAVASVRPFAAGSYRVTATVDTAITHSLAFDATVPVSAGSVFQWTTVAPLPSARAASSAVAFDGRIYVVGGTCDPGFGAPCERMDTPGYNVPILSFDPLVGSWSRGAVLPVPVGVVIGPAAALADGVHFVFGTRHYVYSPASNSWSARAQPPQSVPSYAVAESVDQKLYVLNASQEGSVWVYDPASDQWSARRASGTYSSSPSAVIDGSIYLGGNGFKPLLRYDPRVDAWTTLPPAPLRRDGVTGGAIKGEFCVFGGQLVTYRSSDPFRETYCYNPAANRWTLGPSLPWSQATNLIAAVEFGPDLYAFGGSFEPYSPGTPTETREAARLSIR